MALELRVLGGLECRCDGASVTISSRRQRTLLAALLVHVNNPVSADRLVEAVWPAEYPVNPQRSLQTLVSRLRGALDCGDAGERIALTPAGYVLRAGPGELDAIEFEFGIEAATDLGPSEAVDRLLEALALWRGSPYEEFADHHFAVTEGGRLEDLRLAALEKLGAAHLAAQEPQEAIGPLGRAVNEQPLREGSTALLMRALYSCGRQVEALDRYRAYRRRLGEELGLEPSPTIRQLEQEILDHAVTSVVPEPRTADGLVTVTFLVTEIADAARSWESRPEEMQVVVDRHDALLRQLIEGRQGVVFAAADDGFAAAFSTANHGATAALDIRRALDSETWPPELAPGVQIGIHTGVAIVRSGSYSGQALSRAARLMAIAHPGQTLVSNATHAQLRAADFEDGELTDVGRYRLREMATSERVSQLAPLGSARLFPAPGSAERPGNLRPARDVFVGRERLLEQLSTFPTHIRLVTLTGIGGVGKTRLATEVARYMVDRFVDGVWFCELSTASDPVEANAALATATAVRNGSGSFPLDVLKAVWAHTTTLLVLDNCEHLLDWSAEMIGPLLEACPQLVVIATSREPLGIAGEHVVVVDPLDERSAVALFMERAGAHRAGIGADDADERLAITSICNRLDGLPLAIELAAARVRSMSPTDILSRIHAALDLSAGPERDRTARHKTLRAAIAWSYDLLTEQEARLFDLLAVFSGGFDLDAIERIAEAFDLPADDTVDLVDSLVSKSLVTLTDTALGGRYDLLETIRQYATAMLAERGIADLARKRHAEVFAAEAVRLRNTEPADELTAAVRFDADFDNYISALETAIMLGDARAAIAIATVEDLRRHLTSRHLYWSIRALAVPGAELEPRRTVAASVAAYYALGHDDDIDTAQRWLDQGFTWVEQEGAVPDPFLHGVRALIAFGLGDERTVRDEGLAHIELARQVGDRKVQSHALAVLAVYLGSMNDHGSMSPVALGEEALELARDIGSPMLLEFSLGCLANVLHRADPDRAVELRDEGLAIDSGNIAQLQHVGGRTLLALDRGEDPAPFVARALRHMQLERDLQSDVPVLVAIAAWATRARRPDITARALGHLATTPRTPWLRMGVARDRLAEAQAFVESSLTSDFAATEHANGAHQAASALVRDALTALAPEVPDGGAARRPTPRADGAASQPIH